MIFAIHIWISVLIIRKKASLTPKKVKIGAQKKIILPIHLYMDFLQKKQVQNGQIWPLRPHF